MIKKLEEIADGIFNSDLLVLGGGLAGCMAAIRASQKGLDVIIVEKAALRRSGQAGRGLDHYASIAHPKVNGLSAREYGQRRAAELGGLASSKLSVITAQDALKPIKILEEIGVKLKEEDGTYKLIPHRIGGGVAKQRGEKPIGTAGDCILYRGADLKLRLASEIVRRKIRVFERTMFTGLITRDGSVTGVTALDVRTGRFYVFRAKAVLLSTGGAYSRMYDYPFATFPNNLFTGCGIPTNVGSGQAAAYRAGAKLTNLEFLFVSIQTLCSCPSPQGAVFSAKMKNSQNEELFAKYPEVREKEKGGGFYPWGRYPFMPSMSAPEIERDVVSYYWDGVPETAESFGAFMAANETPIYLKLTENRGGLRRSPYELYAWHQGIIRGFGGVMRNQMGEASLKRLFVAGDVGGAMPAYGSTGAFVWGLRIADYLAGTLPGIEEAAFDNDQMEQVLVERQRVLEPLQRKEGVEPLELEDLTRKIMSYHVGIRKIEPRLRRAIELLEIIKTDFIPKLSAKNPHELMRAVEVQDVVELCGLHARTALLRRETRMPPYHYRVDYPETDETTWRKNLVVYSKNGEMKHELLSIDDAV